jgi:CRP-like cAMP-binding protein
MTLATIPVFQALSPQEQADLLAAVAPRRIPAGEVLCYEGDPAPELWLLREGHCTASRAGHPLPDLSPPALLDPTAMLGALPHSMKITAHTDCDLLVWTAEQLAQSTAFWQAARRYLAETLRHTQQRLAAIEAPIHYTQPGAGLQPGPFIFEDATVIFAFCDAQLDEVRAILPDGLSLIRRPGKRRDSLLLAIADFPNSYPEDNPTARFGYTETTIFVPVRFGTQVGLFTPWIYPSAWEPILLGREIYGFPKQPGLTVFGSRRADLHVDGRAHFALTWDSSSASSETRLVRALMDWLGIQGQGAALAFQAGEVLRKAWRLPAHRRIDAFNHKQILAPSATVEEPVYAVNQLTGAAYGVLSWFHIALLEQPALTVSGGPLAGLDIHLREAFRTGVNMRLSTGRILRDYLADD